MDLSKLTKGQQYIVLGGICSVVLFYGLYLLVGNITDSSRSAGKNLVDLRLKIESAESKERAYLAMVGKYKECAAVLDEQVLKNLPPEDSPYSWVTENIYAQARTCGLNIDTVDEVSREGPAVLVSAGIRIYAVRITLAADYNQLVRLVEFFLASNPLLRISRINITENPTNYKVHEVELIMEWPIGLKVQTI